MNMEDGTASLPAGWAKVFCDEMDAVLNGTTQCNLKTIQVLGGKAIRVVTLFGALRAFCNGIYLAVREHKPGSRNARGAAQVHPKYSIPFKEDLRLIRDCLNSAPSRKLLLKPGVLRSISTGAQVTDSDAPTSWGYGSCIIYNSHIYYMCGEWTDNEKAIFNIADFEGIAYDFTFRFFPRVIPEAFARKHFVGRCDNENVEQAITGSKTAKGVLSLVIKNLLRSQVQHHYLLTMSRVATSHNDLADALSRGDLNAFLSFARELRLTPVNVILTDTQRSTQSYADVKASYGR